MSEERWFPLNILQIKVWFKLFQTSSTGSKHNQLDIDLLHIIRVKTHGFHHWNNLKLSVLWGILLSAPLVISANERKKGEKDRLWKIFNPKYLWKADIFCTHCPTGYHRCFVVKNILLSSSIDGPLLLLSTSLLRWAFSTWSWDSGGFVRGSGRSIGCKIA